jgi:hypothetical protein
MAGFKTRFRQQLPVAEPQLPSRPVVEGDVTPPLRVDSPSPPPGRGTAAASAPTARKAPPLVPKQPPYPPPQIELEDSDTEYVSPREMEIGWEEGAGSWGLSEPILIPEGERALLEEVKEEKVSVKKEKVSAKEESKVDLKGQSLWDQAKSERMGWLEERLQLIQEEGRKYMEASKKESVDEEGLARRWAKAEEGSDWEPGEAALKGQILDDVKKSSAWPEPTRTSETIIESKTSFNAFVIETRNIQILYKQGFKE